MPHCLVDDRDVSKEHFLGLCGGIIYGQESFTVTGRLQEGWRLRLAEREGTMEPHLIQWQ
jgi:hypothetical protein